MGVMVEGERSMATVVQDVVGNLGRIVRAEVRLAKAEVAEEITVVARQAGTAAKALVIGVVLSQLALAFLLLAGMRALEAFFNVAPWLAALLMGVVVAGVAMAVVSSGTNALKRVRLLPAPGLAHSTERGR